MHSAKKDVLKRLSLIILSSFFIVSCGDQSSKTTEKPEEVAKETPASSVPANPVDNNNNNDKLNQYIVFYNDGLININKKLNIYFEYSGNAPLLKQGKGYTSGSKYKYWENIKKVVNEKPVFNKVDEAATQLIPLAEQLDELLASAREYYKAKDYFIDKYAKGQELHTKILASSEKYKAAYEKFDIAIKNEEKQSRFREMEKAKQNGNDVVYNRILVSILTDKIMDELSIQNISSNNVLSTDISKIKPLYEELSKAQEVLREVSKSQKLTKNKDLINEHYSKEYVELTTKFKIAVGDLIERVETKKPLSKIELGMLSSTKGTPEQLNELRKEAIESYNRSS